MKNLILLVIFSVSLNAGVVYQTDFEDCSDSIPPGWLLFDDNGDQHLFAAVQYATAANSGSWFIRYNAYRASINGDDWALSDTFTLRGNEEDTLVFYVRAWNASFPERLKVYLVNGDSPADTVRLLFKDYNITNTSYQQKTIVFKPPKTGVYRIGFYSNSFHNRRAVLVDDVSVYSADITGNNLAIDAVTPYHDKWTGDRMVENDSVFTVVVKNHGNHNFRNTSIFYRIDSSGVTIVPETRLARQNINAGETKTYTFDFKPSIYHMAEYDIYVYHDKVDDRNNTYHGDDTFHMHFIVKGHQGRDSYGWVWRDAYSILGEPGGVAWIELNGDSNAEDLGLDDEGSVTRDLASSIKFYGTDYSQIIIDPNGIISFDREPTGNNYSNDSIPSSNASASLMPFWEDLDPSAGGSVYYRTFGDTLTVVEWYQVPIYDMDSTVTFEVQIQSNLAQSGIYDNIVFVYYDMHYCEDSMNATIGIQDSSAGSGSDRFLYYTYNEKPYVPDWKNNKGIFAIKFYSPEALKVNEIALSSYENPVRIIRGGLFVVDVRKENERFRIWDITGRLLNVNYRISNKKAFIDLSNLSPGIYYMKILSEGRYFKVIKVR